MRTYALVGPHAIADALREERLQADKVVDRVPIDTSHWRCRGMAT